MIAMARYLARLPRALPPAAPSTSPSAPRTSTSASSAPPAQRRRRGSSRAARQGLRRRHRRRGGRVEHLGAIDVRRAVTASATASAEGCSRPPGARARCTRFRDRRARPWCARCERVVVRLRPRPHGGAQGRRRPGQPRRRRTAASAARAPPSTSTCCPPSAIIAAPQSLYDPVFGLAKASTSRHARRDARLHRPAPAPRPVEPARHRRLGPRRAGAAGRGRGRLPLTSVRDRGGTGSRCRGWSRCSRRRACGGGSGRRPRRRSSRRRSRSPRPG